MYLGEVGNIVEGKSGPFTTCRVDLPPGAFLSSNYAQCPSGFAKAELTGSGATQYGVTGAGYTKAVGCTLYACVPIPVAPQQTPANISVQVSPQINTQISPQISPVMQQQFQPSNSPATAGTSQTGVNSPAMQPAPSAQVPPPSAPPAPPAGPIGVNSTSMQPTTPAQLPPAPAPTYAPPPVSYAPAQPEQLPPSPLPSSAAPVAAPQVSPATATPAFDWKIAAIIGAGLFGAMVLSSKRK